MLIMEATRPRSKGHVKTALFVATDMDGYTLCWSAMGRHWMVEHFRIGIVSQHSSLVSGLSALERYSGQQASNFMMFNNPYQQGRN